MTVETPPAIPNQPGDILIPPVADSRLNSSDLPWTRSPSSIKESQTSFTTNPNIFPYSVGLCLTAALCYLNFGYAVGVTNALEGYMVAAAGWCDQTDGIQDAGGKKNNPYCEAAQSRLCLINGVLYIGAMMGAIWGSSLMNLRGRRISLVLANCCYFLGAIVCASGSSTVAYAAGRIITGVGVGITTIGVPTLVTETTPDHQRGFLGGVAQSFIGLGIVFVSFIEIPLISSYVDQLLLNGKFGWRIIRPYFWRICYLIPIIPSGCGLALWLAIYRYDTPNWLVHRQRYSEAHRVLRRIHSHSIMGEDEVSDETNKNNIRAKSVTDLFDLTKDKLMFGGRKYLSITDILRCPIYSYPLFVGMMLATVQQLTGVNSLISSSNRVFVDAGMSSDGAMAATFLMSMANYVATCLASFLIEFLGRKKLLQCGAFVMGLNLMIGAIFIHLSENAPLDSSIRSWESFMTAINIIGAVFAFSMTLGPVTWIYLSEIFPPESAASGMCVCGVVNWLSSFLGIAIGRMLGTESSLFFFSAVGLIGFIGISRYTKESSTDLSDSPLCTKADRARSIHSGLQNNDINQDIFSEKAHGLLIPLFHNKSKEYRELLDNQIQDSLGTKSG